MHSAVYNISPVKHAVISFVVSLLVRIIINHTVRISITRRIKGGNPFCVIIYVASNANLKTVKQNFALVYRISVFKKLPVEFSRISVRIVNFVSVIVINRQNALAVRKILFFRKKINFARFGKIPHLAAVRRLCAAHPHFVFKGVILLNVYGAFFAEIH